MMSHQQPHNPESGGGESLGENTAWGVGDTRGDSKEAKKASAPPELTH